MAAGGPGRGQEPGPRRFVPVAELQGKWRNAPSVDYERMRAEADEFHGSGERIGDEEPDGSGALRRGRGSAGTGGGSPSCGRDPGLRGE